MVLAPKFFSEYGSEQFFLMTKNPPQSNYDLFGTGLGLQLKLFLYNFNCFNARSNPLNLDNYERVKLRLHDAKQFISLTIKDSYGIDFVV